MKEIFLLYRKHKIFVVVLFLQKHREDLGRERKMEENSFEQVRQAADAALIEIRDHIEDEGLLLRLRFVHDAMIKLQTLHEEALETLAQYEEAYDDRDTHEEEEEDKTAAVEAVKEPKGAPAEQNEKEAFELRLTQLAGLSEQFTALGRKRPESICGTFKAQQVNRVLLPLKERMEEDTGLMLSLVSEEGEQSYSDVSLLIQGFLDLCSHYALRHYGRQADLRGREASARGYGYGHR